MNKDPFYVTTPIYYPTGLPHIGTAYTMFIADTLARYHRLQQQEVFFLTGTDEHGANIAQKAAEKAQTPQEYVDSYAEAYQQVWNSLGISHDYFIRTTDPRHEKFAQDLLQRSFDNGDIYEGIYEGWYCDSCEAYYTEDELVDQKCPNHPTKTPVWTKEQNYYFRWSKYQDWLLELYDQNPNFVKPAKWLEYAKNFVGKGLQDIPVTRANVKWGIPVPFAPEQTIYVWYDALPNYLSTLHFPEFAADDYYEKFWDKAVHVIGKDIIKFHAILWPAMLKSAGYPLPQTILTHGFFTIDGQKIGKSNNNAINPQDLIAQYGNDAIRYSILSEFQLGNDGDFNFQRLEVKYQSDLANSWGNLFNRVIHLSNKKEVEWSPEISEAVQAKIIEVEQKYHIHFANLEIFEAIVAVNELVAFGNKYITDKKPWELDNQIEINQILSDLARLIEVVINLFAPILPETSEKAKQAFESRQSVILFPKLEVNQTEAIK